jgi:hypothetical protein
MTDHESDPKTPEISESSELERLTPLGALDLTGGVNPKTVELPTALAHEYLTAVDPVSAPTLLRPAIIERVLETPEVEELWIINRKFVNNGLSLVDTTPRRVIKDHKLDDRFIFREPGAHGNPDRDIRITPVAFSEEEAASLGSYLRKAEAAIEEAPALGIETAEFGGLEFSLGPEAAVQEFASRITRAMQMASGNLASVRMLAEMGVISEVAQLILATNLAPIIRDEVAPLVKVATNMPNPTPLLEQAKSRLIAMFSEVHKLPKPMGGNETMETGVSVLDAVNIARLQLIAPRSIEAIGNRLQNGSGYLKEHISGRKNYRFRV